jgi:NAD(P)-dependent dehydrogenase (short-subunit alcohol dehydrogenase family)
VRINALVPGVTEGQAGRLAAARDRSLDDVRHRVPAGKFLPDDALGNALLYLVHPSSSYVSGEVLVVDGGWSMWGRLHAVAS